MARGQKRHWQLLQNVPKERPSRPVSIGPGIRYTPAGTFAVYVYRDRKDVYVGCFEDIEDAVRERDEAAGATVVGPAKRDGKLTVAAFFDDTYEPITSAELKPSAARSMRSRFNVHVRPVLGERYLAEVDDARIAWFTAALLRKDVSRQTKREVLAIVKRIFDAAVTHRLIPRSPAATVKLPSRERGRISVPPFDVALSIIEGIDGPAARMAAEVMLYCGLRVGEALALTWDDVDLATRTLHVSRAIDQATGVIQTPKTKHAVRDIPLPRILAEKLTTYRGAQEDGRIAKVHAWLFPDPRRSADDPKRPPVLWYGDLTKEHWNVARAKVGATNVGLHALRHLYATRLIAGRTDILTVSHLCGHHSPSFTLAVYGHMLSDAGAVAAQVDAAFA